MAAICRLVSRRLCSNLINQERNSLMYIRTIQIKARRARVYPTIYDYDETNMELGRPTSPHMTIYAFQLTSMLSITHRITGMLLSGYATSFAVATLISGDYKNLLEFMDSVMGNGLHFATKLFFVFPFAFHTINGIRHLLWDLGYFLTLPEVYGSGYVMLVIAAVLSGILASR